jgi:hypothetical protein
MKKRQSTLYFASVCLLLAGIGYACSKSDSPLGASGNGGGNGQGGSMARFAITGDHLYTVDNQTLRTLRLTNPAKPEYLETKDQQLGFDIETIFPYDTLLFIGSQNAMYIYDISRPEFPKELSQVSHFRSCDPVVAAGNYAYVTLNSGNQSCRRGSDELQVYDITDLRNPQLIHTDRNLTTPKGLGVDQAAGRLFVCGGQGLKVYDLSNPGSPEWCDDLTDIPEARGIETYDCIPMDGLLLVIGSDGFYQFDYTGERIRFVSKIDLRKEWE